MTSSQRNNIKHILPFSVDIRYIVCSLFSFYSKLPYHIIIYLKYFFGNNGKICLATEIFKIWRNFFSIAFPYITSSRHIIMEGTSTYYSTREKLPPMVNHFYVRHKRQSIRKLRVKENFVVECHQFSIDRSLLL